MRPANFLSIALFSVFLATPLASLMRGGYASMAVEKPRWADISVPEFIAPEDTYRKKMARSIVSGSPAAMRLVSAKAYFDYRIMGFIDSERVISARDGWLFYKPQFAGGEPLFAGGKCEDQVRQREAINAVRALRTVAAGAGIDLRFSISPDKSIVEQGMLGPQVRAISGCKSQTAEKWRSFNREVGAPVIDHLEEFRTLGGDQQLYFATDTHWNSRARSLALARLAKEYFGLSMVAPKQIGNAVYSSVRDLTTMLRMSFVEDDLTPADFDISPLLAEDNEESSALLILHDSFYAGMAGQLMQLFPEALMVHLEHGDVDEAMAAGPARILINSVERSIFLRILSASLSWNSVFANHLLRLNAENADCKLTEIASDTLGAGANQQVLIDLPALENATKVCVRVSFFSDSQTGTQIFLPTNMEETQNHYPTGLSVYFAKSKPGSRSILLALPGRYGGTRLRIDPIADAHTVEGLKIEAGVY